jgi:hypothetical protein
MVPDNEMARIFIGWGHSILRPLFRSQASYRRGAVFTRTSVPIAERFPAEAPELSSRTIMRGNGVSYIGDP